MRNTRVRMCSQSPLCHETVEYDKRITNWLRLQSNQCDSYERNRATIAQGEINSTALSPGLSNDQLYVNIERDHDTVNKGQQDSSNSPSPKFGRQWKTNELHFPRLACSQERLREISNLTHGRRTSEEATEWISCLLDGIEEKAVHMSNQNERIHSELTKMSEIINNLKIFPNGLADEKNSIEYPYDEEMVHTSELNGYVDSERKNTVSTILDRPFYAENSHNDDNTAFPKWKSREFTTESTRRGNSSNRMKNSIDLRLSLCGQQHGHSSPCSLTENSRINDPPDELSSAPFFQQSSPTPTTRLKESSMEPLGTNGPKYKESKFPWFARALSQLSLTEPFVRFRKEKSSDQTSCQHLPNGSQTTLNSQSNSPKGPASATLKIIRRKTNSPAPSPMVISSPILLHGFSEQRCMSMGHLKETKRTQSINQNEARIEGPRLRGGSPLLGTPRNQLRNGLVEIPIDEPLLSNQDKLPTHRRSPIRREMFTNSINQCNSNSLTKSILKQY